MVPYPKGGGKQEEGDDSILGVGFSAHRWQIGESMPTSQVHVQLECNGKI